MTAQSQAIQIENHVTMGSEMRNQIGRVSEFLIRIGNEARSASARARYRLSPVSFRMRAARL
jgi:hypothetical protein